MKICRNELLLLGGMYQLAAFIIALFNTQLSYAMGGVLYVLFWVAGGYRISRLSMRWYRWLLTTSLPVQTV